MTLQVQSGSQATPAQVAETHTQAWFLLGAALREALEHLVACLQAAGLVCERELLPYRLKAEMGLAVRSGWSARLREPASAVRLVVQMELHTMPARLAPTAQRAAVRFLQDGLMQCDATVMEHDTAWPGTPPWARAPLSDAALRRDLLASALRCLQP